MKLAEEFRLNADEWQQIGKIAATDEHRRRTAEIAYTWLAWAERRERMLCAGNRKLKAKRAAFHAPRRSDRTRRAGPINLMR